MAGSVTVQDEDVDTEVVIVGAGPTGLTLACDLARNGVALRIIERDTAVNRASKAKTIQPRAIEVLDDLGAAGRVRALGVAEIPMRFHGPDGSVTDRPAISNRADGSFHTPYPDPLWIGQFDVEAALRHRLAELGRRVELGVTLTGIAQDDRGVTVTTSTGTIRARYAVAADGGRSTVRELLSLPLVGITDETQRWYLGDVRTEGLDRDHLHIWPSPEGMLGLTPLPGSDLFQLQSAVAADVVSPPPPSLALYQRMLDDRGGTVTLTDASWLSLFRTNVRVLDSFRDGRVLLAGDAAHVHSPAGGQGMNTGIQDAYNLGWKLAAILRGADDALLDTYTAERRPVARAVLGDSTVKMTRTMATATGEGEALAGTLRSLSDDVTSGLPVAYPDSPLTLVDTDRGDGLPAGSRVPDAGGLTGRDAAGAPFRGSLFDLLRGTHWTLLVFDHDAELRLDAADPDHLHVHRVGTTLDDAQGQVRARLDARPGELVLIRPDGYLAARVPAGEEARLLALLGVFRLEWWRAASGVIQLPTQSTSL